MAAGVIDLAPSELMPISCAFLGADGVKLPALLDFLRAIGISDPKTVQQVTVQFMKKTESQAVANDGTPPSDSRRALTVSHFKGLLSGLEKQSGQSKENLLGLFLLRKIRSLFDQIGEASSADDGDGIAPGARRIPLHTCRELCRTVAGWSSGGFGDHVDIAELEEHVAGVPFDPFCRAVVAIQRTTNAAPWEVWAAAGATVAADSAARAASARSAAISADREEGRASPSPTADGEEEVEVAGDGEGRGGLEVDAELESEPLGTDPAPSVSGSAAAERPASAVLLETEEPSGDADTGVVNPNAYGASVPVVETNEATAVAQNIALRRELQKLRRRLCDAEEAASRVRLGLHRARHAGAATAPGDRGQAARSSAAAGERSTSRSPPEHPPPTELLGTSAETQTLLHYCGTLRGELHAMREQLALSRDAQAVSHFLSQHPRHGPQPLIDLLHRASPPGRGHSAPAVLQLRNGNEVVALPCDFPFVAAPHNVYLQTHFIESLCKRVCREGANPGVSAPDGGVAAFASTLAPGHDAVFNPYLAAKLQYVERECLPVLEQRQKLMLERLFVYYESAVTMRSMHRSLLHLLNLLVQHYQSLSRRTPQSPLPGSPATAVEVRVVQDAIDLGPSGSSRSREPSPVDEESERRGPSWETKVVHVNAEEMPLLLLDLMAKQLFEVQQLRRGVMFPLQRATDLTELLAEVVEARNMVVAHLITCIPMCALRADAVDSATAPVERCTRNMAQLIQTIQNGTQALCDTCALLFRFAATASSSKSQPQVTASAPPPPLRCHPHAYGITLSAADLLYDLEVECLRCVSLGPSYVQCVAAERASYYTAVSRSHIDLWRVVFLVDAPASDGAASPEAGLLHSGLSPGAPAASVSRTQKPTLPPSHSSISKLTKVRLIQSPGASREANARHVKEIQLSLKTGASPDDRLGYGSARGKCRPSAKEATERLAAVLRKGVSVECRSASDWIRGDESARQVLTRVPGRLDGSRQMHHDAAGGTCTSASDGAAGDETAAPISPGTEQPPARPEESLINLIYLVWRYVTTTTVATPRNFSPVVGVLRDVFYEFGSSASGAVDGSSAPAEVNRPLLPWAQLPVALERRLARVLRVSGSVGDSRHSVFAASSKLASCLFHFGLRKIELALLDGHRVIVRVGGGFTDLHEYTAKYGSAESYRFDKHGSSPSAPA